MTRIAPSVAKVEALAGARPAYAGDDRRQFHGWEERRPGFRRDAVAGVTGEGGFDPLFLWVREEVSFNN